MFIANPKVHAESLLQINNIFPDQNYKPLLYKSFFSLPFLIKILFLILLKKEINIKENPSQLYSN